MYERLVAIALVLGLLSALAAAGEPPFVTRSRLGMVASDSAEASLIGAQMLAEGGNAFDAAITTSIALGITRPNSTGLGGGGFMVAYLAREKRFVVYDFRETAPAGATPQQYAKLVAEAGDGPPPTVYGGSAVAIPGLLAGLVEIQKRFASRTLREHIELAQFLAERGFTVNEHYHLACQSTLAEYERWPQLKERYPQVYRTLLGSGTPPAVGQRVKRPDLGQALRLIAERGPDVFYKGEIGAAIVEAVQAAGGTLTMRDLANYQVRERPPLRGNYGDYQIVTMPPPSSGGICLLEALNVLQSARQRSDLPPEAQPHVLVEALKHAFADRATWLGDPDFSTVPAERLISPDYAGQLAARIQPDRTLNSDAYGSRSSPSTGPAEDRGTSHFCVADRYGNVVAITETINGPFGSLVVAEPYGIILNNEMDDFVTSPGKPNLYGLIQSEANTVEPGKRPLSSMAPTIVMKDQRPVLVLGGSGGPRIISSVLQVLLNVIDRRMPLGEAIDAVRLHHQWLPDEVYFDREPPEEILTVLRKAGHKISPQRREGAVQAIQFLDDGTMVGASDPRRGGRPTALIE